MLAGVADDSERGLPGGASVGTDPSETEALADDDVDLLLDVSAADVAVDHIAEACAAFRAGIGFEQNIGAAIAAGGPVAVDGDGELGLLGVDIGADGICDLAVVTDDLQGESRAVSQRDSIVAKRFSSV